MMPKVTKFQVGGKEYELGAVAAFGEVAAWQLVRHDGKQMTADQFKSLPATQQQELLAHVDKWAKANGMHGLV